MRTVRILSIFLFLCSFCVGAELKIRVVDPSSAVVASARVTVSAEKGGRSLAVISTAADGTATVAGLNPGRYRVQILAPGFAEKNVTATVPADQATSVELEVATTSATVVVSATATPAPQEETGNKVSVVDADTLVTMNQPSLGDVLRFLPGINASSTGRNGSLTTLFVRGGESRYNKVIVDGVPVNEPGGSFDFGVVPTQEVQRIEVLRGAASSLYGSDAMTSVVQLWSRTGTTAVPQLTFGAEGGTFGTARGYAAFNGVRGRFDYNIFGEQFNTDGQGVNDEFSNSSQGANLGVKLSSSISLRWRTRHSNSRTGVPSNWWFNGGQIISPDTDQFARQNNFQTSLDLSIAAPGNWQHHVTGFEYNHYRKSVDMVNDPGRPFDDPFDARANFNRAGLQETSEYTPRPWAHTFVGYYMEDENEYLDSAFVSFGFPGGSHTHGTRVNQAVFGEQFINWKRLSLLGGVRVEHNESFGTKGIPRASATVVALRGGHFLSGTRLRFSYSEGVKAPTFEEAFGSSGSFPTEPNPKLRSEFARNFETGFQQSFVGGKYALSGTYFNNHFTDQIQFRFDPNTFLSQFINLNKAIAHGAELELSGRITKHLSLDGSYVYTSTQALDSDECLALGAGCTNAGQPLLRRPKHYGQILVTYFTSKWGGSLGGTFVGRRPDSDFFTAPVPVDYAAGYGRVDISAWRTINRYMTAYATVGNALNKRYNDVVGYPGLKANFRAGMRFRIGGE